MGLIVKEILNIGKTRLEQAGIAEAKNDSEELMCFLLGMDKAKLFMHWSDELQDKQCDRYFELMETRENGKPLQYITGNQNFMGIDFKVDSRVLIPRPETEILVSEGIRIIREKKIPHTKVLDLCCGSGAIAVAIERYVTTNLYTKDAPLDISVTASDVSTGAIELAKQNAAQNSSKVNFVQGDLFKPFDKALRTIKFDVILSNPPYIPSDDIPSLQVEVREHEPLLALDGGTDGLLFYRKIIASAPKHLKKEGVLILEIGADQADAVTNLAAENGFEEAEILQDFAGKDRVVVLSVGR